MCKCAARQTGGELIRGPTFDILGGGGAGVFVAGKLFISTGLGGALKISHFVTCLYRTVLEVYYIFHAESARNYLFQKTPAPPPPPPWKSNGGPLKALLLCGDVSPANVRR